MIRTVSPTASPCGREQVTVAVVDPSCVILVMLTSCNAVPIGCVIKYLCPFTSEPVGPVTVGSIILLNDAIESVGV